jgi:phosphomevalonate kinase
VKVLAPGKAFIFGEYAVLEGAPAIVMAVARYVRAHRAGGALSPLAALVNEAAARDLPPGSRRIGFDVDSSELSLGDSKLGLGSSAAACAAGAALLFHEANESLASDAVRRAVFRAARAAHDRLQGEAGSGADVAACVEGGLLRYETAGGGRWKSVRLPVRLRLVFAHTGVSASTAALVSRVRELRASQPGLYHRRLNVLADLSEALGPEPEERTASEVCLMVHSYVAHLDALGRDAGAPIVSEPHHRIAEIARSVGCAAKPSGAGGGDLAVVFCPDPASAVAARDALCAGGFSPLDLQTDLTGVRLEPEEPLVA